MGPTNHVHKPLTLEASPVALQTPADKITYTVRSPMKVIRFMLTVTTQMTVTPAVVALDKRVTPGSDTGRIEVKRITVPLALTVGKVIFSQMCSVDFMPGEQIVIELITAATAGAVHVDLLLEHFWEEPINTLHSSTSV
jgi:hypothetical protein